MLAEAPSWPLSTALAQLAQTWAGWLPCAPSVRRLRAAVVQQAVVAPDLELQATGSAARVVDAEVGAQQAPAALQAQVDAAVGGHAQATAELQAVHAHAGIATERLVGAHLAGQRGRHRQLGEIALPGRSLRFLVLKDVEGGQRDRADVARLQRIEGAGTALRCGDHRVGAAGAVALRVLHAQHAEPQQRPRAIGSPHSPLLSPRYTS
ncbi:hypothetical protein G6F31_017444 [Rhizopus arrhizus]|nr:hypothetical protein G6F31_017444 [Rhizopus arrhizus]